MNIIQKYWKVLLSVFFAVVVWCFWGLKYASGMVYQEQLQLFLFDSELLLERLAVPGGIARYVSEFLVQFYNVVQVGAVIIACVYVLLQLATWKLVKKQKVSDAWYLLSYIPVILLWMYMGDINVRLSFAISMLIAMTCMVVYPEKSSSVAKNIYVAISVPFVYWITGPAVLMLAVYIAIKEILANRNFIISAVAIVLSVACMLASAAFVPYPVARIFYGIGYNYVVDVVAVMQYIVMAAFVIIPIVISVLPEQKEGKTSRFVFAGVLAGVVSLAVIAVPANYLPASYEVLDYDLLVRQQKWNEIIEKAEKKTPDTPLTVSSLNLALAMTGQLNEQRAFQFFQNGWQGAFPVFNKNFESSLMTAEIYYQTGMVNTAQRFDFEAMEAIPDNGKSARIIKRLAETNLINGQYKVSLKYLRILQKTMYYRNWANETIALLGNEKAINEHPVYGYLRKCRLTKDFLFSEQEIDKIMGQLVVQNSKNVVAMQYLLFLPQLEGNQQKYMLYRNFVDETLKKQKNQ